MLSSFPLRRWCLTPLVVAAAVWIATAASFHSPTRVANAWADDHAGEHHDADHDHAADVKLMDGDTLHDGEFVEHDGDADHAHAEGHDEEGTPPLLQLNLGSAICNLLIFLGVFAILAKFVWPPILEGLKAREQKIHGDLIAAEKANAEAKAMLADYQVKLDEASTQVQTMLADARKDAEVSANKIVEDARAESERHRERSMADIEAAKKAALADLADQTAAMAIGVAGKVVGRELRPEDHAELIRSSLDRLPSDN